MFDHSRSLFCLIWKYFLVAGVESAMAGFDANTYATISLKPDEVINISGDFAVERGTWAISNKAGSQVDQGQ